MDRKAVRSYKERLLELRRRLRGDVCQMAYVPDCEMSLRLLSGKEQMLQQIEHALEQMEDGKYGRCERCERRIPQARLTAVPYTTVCAGCASHMTARPEDSRLPSAEPAEATDPRSPGETCRPPVRPPAARRNRARRIPGQAGEPVTQSVR